MGDDERNYERMAREISATIVASGNTKPYLRGLAYLESMGKTDLLLEDYIEAVSLTLLEVQRGDSEFVLTACRIHEPDK